MENIIEITNCHSCPFSHYADSCSGTVCELSVKVERPIDDCLYSVSVACPLRTTPYTIKYQLTRGIT
jgi:predicted ArsR family transcriptional regulator